MTNRQIARKALVYAAGSQRPHPTQSVLVLAETLRLGGVRIPRSLRRQAATLAVEAECLIRGDRELVDWSAVRHFMTEK